MNVFQVKVTCITMKEFMEWFENKLNDKFDSSLQGLKLRFLAFYNILKGILTYMIEMNQLYAGEKNSENSYARPLIDNCINILKVIISEYPACLDLEFCERFLESINDNVDLLKANFHPLTHFETANSSKNKRISAICNEINNAFAKIPESIEEIQKRADLSVPLLKYIEDSLSHFRYQFASIMEDIKELKSNRIFQEYQTAFNEFLNHIYKENKKNSKGDHVKKMIHLIKDSCLNQLQLETILDTPIKLCQLIKNRGRRLISEDIKHETQTLILKYVNIMVKQDFISSHLINLPLNELISVIKCLEEQGNLLTELKKQPTFISGIDEVMFVNEDEFRDILSKWKKCNQEIGELQSNSSYQEQFIAYKASLAVSFLDVRKFSDKLWEFQKSLVQYHRICNKITKLKQQVQKYFLKKFHERVELISDEI